MATTPCWRICEVSPTDQLMTLICLWRGSRHLPLGVTMKAEPFTKALEGRDTTFVGFHVYVDEAVARQALDRMGLGRRLALVYGDATGLQPAFSEPGLYLANELKLVNTVARNY